MEPDGIEIACQPRTDLERLWVGRLPPRILNKDVGIYGAAEIAARYCGLHYPPHAHALGEWQHGWEIKEANTDPELVIGHVDSTKIPRRSRFWVARRDQEQFLRQHGFSNAKAIGLPICYLERPQVERIFGSLLIMPVHTSWKSAFFWNTASFSDYLRVVLEDHSVVLACLHTVDYAEGRWLGTLRDLHIPVVAGARSIDRNALYRMATLFSMFETVVTNGFGSHWAYAQLFGAKLAVDGPFCEDEIYARLANKYQRANVHSEAALKEAYPTCFCSIDQAICDVQWARQELGCDNLLHPNELRHELGWDTSGLVEHAINRILDRSKRLFGPR